ncbi:putative receptor-type tyrosine-protein phosphatase delta-like 3 [Homarus americanus]|uniref:Putative receptor-type tyrosine-protein phosphatase delta-like 3 n=1 Tax=Homarus americanus TaxID=6706 RepID=A0A8J5K9M6_HOMAM|nr:putative receptor-type tyrosine-protein phosphatase delta-like 3 [Homarus americanus]
MVIARDHCSSAPEATQKVSCDLPTSPHDLTVTWSSIMSSCPVLRYTVNYTGHVLWSHDNTHGSRDTDTIYVDLRNLTPWTAYNVCVAGVIVNNIVGAWNCCQATTPESVLLRSKLYLGSTRPPASLNLTDKSSSVKAGTAAGVGPPVWDAVTTDKGVNVGGIVAGVVVGVLLLALIVAAVVFRDKLKDKMKKRTTPTIPPQDSSMTPVPSVVHDDVKMRKQWQVEDDQRGGEEFTPRGTTAATTKVFYTTCSADHVYVNTDCGDDEDDDHVYMYRD